MNLRKQILNILKNPDFCDLSIDDPKQTIRRKQIIQQKDFLRKIYEEWYTAIAALLPAGDKPVLEIGSGAGFMADYIKPLIRSDILLLPDVDVVMDACSAFPFDDSSLRGIVMVNTLHHLPDCLSFFSEANRCLEPGGVIVMIEPWVTPWSSFIYKILLHEPFDMNAKQWHFATTGPLSGANGALPWILFSRDGDKFAGLFPNLLVERIVLQMPLLYLLSGGVSMRSLVPDSSFAFWQTCERLLEPLLPKTAMFALIVLREV